MNKSGLISGNTIDFTLTNVSGFSNSTISLFSTLDSTNNSFITDDGYYNEFRLSNSDFNDGIYIVEIFRVSSSTWVNIGSTIDRDNIQTNLDSVTGQSWSYYQGSEYTFYYCNSTSLINFNQVRVDLGSKDLTDIGRNTIISGTTIHIDIEGSVSYIPICQALNNGRYRFTSVSIFADTVSQLNNSFSKKIINSNGLVNIDYNKPFVSSLQKQFVYIGLEIDYDIANNDLDYKIYADDSVRLIFEYQESKLASLENPYLYPPPQIIDKTTEEEEKIKETTVFDFIFGRLTQLK